MGSQGQDPSPVPDTVSRSEHESARPALKRAPTRHHRRMALSGGHAVFGVRLNSVDGPADQRCDGRINRLLADGPGISLQASFPKRFSKSLTATKVI